VRRPVTGLHHRDPAGLRSWIVGLALAVLSTVAGGLPSSSIVWSGSQTPFPDVAVTVAVNPDHSASIDLLDYRVTAGRSRGPPIAIDAQRTREHTYYVLAGTTPVLVHNCGDGARFVLNNAGDVLDTARVTIPEGKFGYLLENPSKSGVFADSMGFDPPSLRTALENHLVDNFGKATPSVPMTGGGTKFTVRGPMTGLSGQTWNITTAWGIDPNGTIRLITATP
jgi:hypothetical protein